MSRAGFVLAGGKSSRMGKDKALLPFRGGTLAGYVAAAAAEAAGTVTIIGDPAKYGNLGYRTEPDRAPGSGPLGGIETALSLTSADWNLVLACDLPGISGGFLRELLDAAESSGADILVPSGPSGRREPLCAVYHRRCHAAFRRSLDSGIRKVTEAFTGLRAANWNIADPACFANLNTPEEWACYEPR